VYFSSAAVELLSLLLFYASAVRGVLHSGYAWDRVHACGRDYNTKRFFIV